MKLYSIYDPPVTFVTPPFLRGATTYNSYQALEVIFIPLNKGDTAKPRGICITRIISDFPILGASEGVKELSWGERKGYKLFNHTLSTKPKKNHPFSMSP